MLIAVGVMAACAAIAFGVAWQRRRRRRTVVELLDAADALEARLRDARTEIEAVSDRGDDAVQSALREMLRQRLWLQQHGPSASLHDLRQVRDAIEQAGTRVQHQLQRVEQARAPGV